MSESDPKEPSEFVLGRDETTPLRGIMRAGAVVLVVVVVVAGIAWGLWDALGGHPTHRGSMAALSSRG